METIKSNTTKVNAIRIRSDLRSGDDLFYQFCIKGCDEAYGVGSTEANYCKTLCKKIEHS